MLATPLLVFIAVGLAPAREPRLTAEIVVERSRILEGDEVRVTLTMRNHGRATEVELAPIRSRYLSLDPETTARIWLVNWRATARRGALHVPARHPEHATDVVLLLDTFAEARDETGGTLDVAIRATASLTRGHLARRERVALVDFGGGLQWLEPAFGTAQLYRIIDALLASEVAFS